MWAIFGWLYNVLYGWLDNDPLDNDPLAIVLFTFLYLFLLLLFLVKIRVAEWVIDIVGRLFQYANDSFRRENTAIHLLILMWSFFIIFMLTYGIEISVKRHLIYSSLAAEFCDGEYDIDNKTITCNNNSTKIYLRNDSEELNQYLQVSFLITDTYQCLDCQPIDNMNVIINYDNGNLIITKGG